MVNLGGMAADDEFLHGNIDEELGEENDAKSTNFIFFDEPDQHKDAAITQSLKADTERNLIIILADLFALTDTQLCILRHLLFGEDYATIGRTLPKPISKEAVHKCILAISKKHQFVASVMRQMQIKGIGGAKRKQAYNLELDL